MPESKRRKPKIRPASPLLTSVERSQEPSSPWYVAVMTGLMMVGVLLVLARFIFQLDQLLLVGGLAAIVVGFLMTTNYR